MPHTIMTKDKIKAMLLNSMTPGLRNREAFKDHGKETIELQESMGEDTLLESLERFPDLMANNDLGALQTELMEAGISESMFAVFTRAGVESVIQDGYKVKEDRFLNNKLQMVVPSKRYLENYAWLFNPDMPQPLGDMEEPQETDIIPRTLAVANEDFGIAACISQRLIDDEQTGELVQTFSRIGRNHAAHEEIYWAGYLTAAAFSHSGVSVPAANYSDPDGTTGVYTTTTNRANAISPAALTATSLQALLDLMDGIEDPNGKLIMPDIDTLVTGTFYRWDAAALVNSAFYPTAAGTTAGAFMQVNQLGPQSSVLKAPVVPYMEPYFNQTNDKKKWYVMEKKARSLCKQSRQPLELLMESPTSGFSLRTRSRYQRTYIRYAEAWFDARYNGRGSDGTV